MQEIVINIFAGISLLSALMVILAKNPVKAVLSLILTFFSTAAVWLFLEAEFLALLLVVVYVGAVMVLFLFVVMMLDIDFTTAQSKFTSWMSAAVCVPVLLLILIVDVISDQPFLHSSTASLSYGIGYSNINMLGKLLFTEYLFQFEVAGIILLVAMIAAISLIHRGPQKRRLQDVDKQIKTRREDRVRLVSGD